MGVLWWGKGVAWASSGEFVFIFRRLFIDLYSSARFGVHVSILTMAGVSCVVRFDFGLRRTPALDDRNYMYIVFISNQYS